LEEKKQWNKGGVGTGISDRENIVNNNNHPTVKPISLMRYLCRLVTPKGGTVLDPFLGSGTTGIGAIMEGFGFVGIEKEKDYIKIAEARMSHWNKKKEEEMRQEVLL
jgi:site-specific DNA-methyltransferase (adenine-specific)